MAERKIEDSDIAVQMLRDFLSFVNADRDCDESERIVNQPGVVNLAIGKNPDLKSMAGADVRNEVYRTRQAYGIGQRVKGRMAYTLFEATLLSDVVAQRLSAKKINQ